MSSQTNSHFPITIFYSFSSAVLAICFYLVFYLGFIYLLTEFLGSLGILIEVRSGFNSLILIIFIFFFSLANWRKIFKSTVSLFILLSLTVSLALWTQKFINSEREKARILWINPGWGIQGSLLIIKGRNFGPPAERGEVFLDGERMVSIQEWTDKEIILIQSVPKGFGKRTVYVVTREGERSNETDFEIKNPTEVLKTQ